MSSPCVLHAKRWLAGCGTTSRNFFWAPESARSVVDFIVDSSFLLAQLFSSFQSDRKWSCQAARLVWKSIRGLATARLWNAWREWMILNLHKSQDCRVFFVTTQCLYQNQAFCGWKEDVPAVEWHPCWFMFVCDSHCQSTFLFEIMSQATTLASWLHDNVATEAQQVHFEPSWTLAFGTCLWLHPLLLRSQTCSNNLLENCQAAVQHVQRQAWQGDLQNYIQHRCEKRIKLQKEIRSMAALQSWWCDVAPKLMTLLCAPAPQHLDVFITAISKNLDGSRDHMAQKIQRLIHFFWLHKLRNRYLSEKVHSLRSHPSHGLHTEGDFCTVRSKLFLPETK